MKNNYIDITWLKNSADVHDYLQKTLVLPEHYGKNLDALYDELTAITEERHIYLFYTPEDNTELKAQLPSFIKIFTEAAQSNPKILFTPQEINNMA